MKAIEAKKIATESRDTTDYVEREISTTVESSAKEGHFQAEVYVHTLDVHDCYRGFIEKVKDALIRLGYKVESESGHAGGISFIISWG